MVGIRPASTAQSFATLVGAVFLITGVVAWGTPQSGFIGIEEGPYAYQHAEVNLLWQAVGLAVVIAIGLVTAHVLAFILERTIGLRVSEEAEEAGLDISEHGMYGYPEQFIPQPEYSIGLYQPSVAGTPVASSSSRPAIGEPAPQT
jgi:hypothetical protein